MRILPLLLLPFLLAASAAGSAAADQPGTTTIAKWKDGKKAAFVIEFDDSLPSQVKNAIPELEKRGLVGTFYLNPGAGHYAANRAVWEKDAPAAGMEIGNHTFTHKGGATVADIEHEIVAANEAIHAARPDEPWPRLISYARPGGIPKDHWPATPEDVAAILAKYHLVERPPVGGCFSIIELKTAEALLKVVDRALEKGNLGQVIFHGVGGDWIVTPLPMFTAFLDGIEKHKADLWITGHIPAYQYATERDAAAVKSGESSAQRITVSLTCTADPQFFNQPLTLVTAVPAEWKGCAVDQGKRHAEVAVEAGQVRYDALPGSEPITLTPR